MMATQALPEERYAYSFNRQIEHVKRHVKCIDVADLLCGPAGNRSGLKKVGDKWVALCPLPDHNEKTPSFTVYEDPERGFYCFGCNRGGDVLELWMLAGGISEKWAALVSLAMEYGVELVSFRSERWLQAGGRKNAYRDTAYQVLGDVLMRRLYRTLILPYVDAITDPQERERELARSWKDWQGALTWRVFAERLLRGDEEYLRTVARLKLEADGVE